MLPALRVISHIIRVACLTGGFYAPVFICIDRAHFYGYLHSDCLVIFCYAMFHIFCSWGGGGGGFQPMVGWGSRLLVFIGFLGWSPSVGPPL